MNSQKKAEKILFKYKEESSILLENMFQILTRVYRKIEEKPYNDILKKLADNENNHESTV